MGANSTKAARRLSPTVLKRETLQQPSSLPQPMDAAASAAPAPLRANKTLRESSATPMDDTTNADVLRNFHAMNWSIDMKKMAPSDFSAHNEMLTILQSRRSNDAAEGAFATVPRGKADWLQMENYLWSRKLLRDESEREHYDATCALAQQGIGGQALAALRSCVNTPDTETQHSGADGTTQGRSKWV